MPHNDDRGRNDHDPSRDHAPRVEASGIKDARWQKLEGRPESFVDAYLRGHGRVEGVSKARVGVPEGDPKPGRPWRAESEGPFDDSGLEDQPSTPAASTRTPTAAQGGTPFHIASTHASPDTPHLRPVAMRTAERIAVHAEPDDGWSGPLTPHPDDAFGSALRNRPWEVPFERDPSTAWGARPHLGTGPRGYFRSDEGIREQVCHALADSHVDANHVEVDVKGGVVVLSGQVADKVSKREIEDIADRCRGVQSVDNHIRVQGVTTGHGGAGAASTSSGDGAALSGRGDWRQDVARVRLLNRP